MTKFEDMINVYHSQHYPDDDYCSSSFNEEIKQLYEKNKAEIFNYYEPKALAAKMAGISDNTVFTVDKNLYSWQLYINTSKMKLMFYTKKRPDLYYIKYISETNSKLGMDMMQNSYNLYTNQLENEITKFFESEVNKILETLPIPCEIYNCDFRIKIDNINISQTLCSDIDIIVRQIPSLENIKLMEYTIPRIMYDKMINIDGVIKQL